MLSDFQITIPEIGTIKAEQPPIVVITSNRTREIHDALKRRCFYYWIDYPSAERELEILHAQGARRGEPSLTPRGGRLRAEAARHARICSSCRASPRPSTGPHALTQLDVLALTPEAINDTLGVLLKYQDDIAKIQGSEAERLLSQVKAELAGVGII